MVILHQVTIITTCGSCLRYWMKQSIFPTCVSCTRLCIERLILKPCVWVLRDARDTTHICCELVIKHIKKQRGNLINFMLIHEWMVYNFKKTWSPFMYGWICACSMITKENVSLVAWIPRYVYNWMKTR